MSYRYTLGTLFLLVATGKARRQPGYKPAKPSLHLECQLFENLNCMLTTEQGLESQGVDQQGQRTQTWQNQDCMKKN